MAFVLYLLYLLCGFHLKAASAASVYDICATQHAGWIATGTFVQGYPEGETQTMVGYRQEPIQPLTAQSTPTQVYWHDVNVYTSMICSQIHPPVLSGPPVPPAYTHPVLPGPPVPPPYIHAR